MALFDIVFGNVPGHLLPIELRQPIHKSWLKALLEGSIGVLYDKFKANRAANLYYLSHNGQVVYLEKVLNDLFDFESRRIYITDPMYLDAVFLYNDDVLRPVFLYNDGDGSAIYLYNDEDILASQAGFIVHVPATLVYDAARLRALVNKYRLKGKPSWIVATY